jgi:hypothetical protein
MGESDLLRERLEKLDLPLIFGDNHKVTIYLTTDLELDGLKWQELSDGQLKAKVKELIDNYYDAQD